MKFKRLQISWDPKRVLESAPGLIVCKGAPFKERRHPEDMNFFTRDQKQQIVTEHYLLAWTTCGQKTLYK